MISNKLILVGYEFIPAIGLCVGWEKRTDYTDTVNNKGPQLLLILPFIALNIEFCLFKKTEEEKEYKDGEDIPDLTKS
jgi:hypothetical protein